MNALLVLFVLTVIFGSYLWIRQERKRTAVRIKALKRITDLRIEEARMESARETSGRIGQNLHDELSASLAGIVHHMEALTLETNDEHFRESINLLKAETGKVYESVRDKSHLLYPGSYDYRSEHFDENIKKITNFLLPDKLYRKEIDIDKKVAERLSTEQKLEILRILKEAATNILKHAKKATEVFVFLYEGENRKIIFQVGDNGNTFKGSKDGMGLSSIRKRVLRLKGNFSLETRDGTLLTVTLPFMQEPELI